MLMLSFPEMIKQNFIDESPSQETLKEVVLDCGWGNLIFANTFQNPEKVAQALCDEEPGKRNIVYNLTEPHVVLSMAPQEIFLDPSHHFRLLKKDYVANPEKSHVFKVRPFSFNNDTFRINEIFQSRSMVPVSGSFLNDVEKEGKIKVFLAEESKTKKILGVISCLDHEKIYHDPHQGASLWSLAVDPQASQPGLGEALVRHCAEHMFKLGREYIDLSVLHDNKQAIRLYEKLGFYRLPLFFLKHKSAINETLYTGPIPENQLNPYAKIIIDEARRRGIATEILDEPSNLFSLSYGGRTLNCHESLTELTSSIALQICSDKSLTHRILSRSGIQVPQQVVASDPETNKGFLECCGRIVVKPAQGEQGEGISVGLSNPEDLEDALLSAEKVCERVLLEEFIEGQDLRVLVIKNEVVAAAIRHPAEISGTGFLTVRKLIEKQSRRRQSATGGESSIPVDNETLRCVKAAGFEMDSVLKPGETLKVRRTANLHTGGTIQDVTGSLHSELVNACLKAAQVINIPVVGFDLMVKDVKLPEYHFIEANERPGLANHEPHPTAERFIDLLFPQTAIQGKL